MTFEELLAQMSEEHKAIVTGKLTEIETAGAAEITKKNNEAKNLRTRAKELEALEASIKARFGVETVNDEFLTQLERSTSTQQSAEQQIAALKAVVEAEKKAKTELATKLTAIEHVSREKQRDDAVLAALSKVGIHSEAIQAAAKLVALDSEWDATDSKWVYKGSDLDTYMTSFVASHSYLIANPVPGGTTTQTKPAGGGNAANKDFISKERYEQMTPKERAANLELIKKSVPKWKMS